MSPARMVLVALPILVILTGCGDPGASSDNPPPPPPPPAGTLRVQTATVGNDPDPDGYRLGVDEQDAITLEPTGTLDLELEPGLHRLTLIGVARQCSVDVATPLQVEVRRDTITTVAFGIDCPLTGARVAVSTGGLDRDESGYKVAVDGVELGSLGQADVLLVRLDPGERTIALTDLAPNCTAEDPSRRIAITRGEVVALSFLVECTAATGVIRIDVHASGSDLVDAFVLTVESHRFSASYSEPNYVSVPAGPHVVSLVAPRNCTVRPPTRTVTVTAGGPVRDTVAASFAVSCVSAAGYVRITIALTGQVHQPQMSIWVCDYADSYYCRYSQHTSLGFMMPGDTLVAGLRAGVHRAWLEDLAGCGGTTAFSPSAPFTVTHGDSAYVTLHARC